MPKSTKPRYTPGPWRIEPDQPSQGDCLCIIGRDGSVIARTPVSPKGYNSKEQKEIDVPNARLIAQAPKMAETLADIAADISALDRASREVERTDIDAVWELLFRIRNRVGRIAKAAGAK